ncbi:MAG: Transcriptional regulator [Bacillales bacterium]|jgi:DNA-binding transcriptional LysR family regulator|nr:Transcriptional regulator [Bacillales bacterium]
MDLHQLYVFTKVVEHKSFSKAADDIFLSQSTISSHIQSLEKSLNITLFDRVGRESILTPSGQKLYDWALKLLLLKDQAILDIKEGNNDFKGTIKVAVSTVPSQFIIPGMIKKFREEYSNVTFHLTQYPSKVVSEKVLNGSVDFGILGEKYENDKLCYIPLTKEKLVLITSNSINLAEPVTFKKIMKYPIIMRNSDSGTNSIFEKFLKSNQILKDELNIIAYTESLVEFVMQDMGIAIISEIAARNYVKNNMIKMYEIEEFNDERNFYLVYNINKTQSLVSLQFIKRIKLLL